MSQKNNKNKKIFAFGARIYATELTPKAPHQWLPSTTTSLPSTSYTDRGTRDNPDISKL